LKFNRRTFSKGSLSFGAVTVADKLAWAQSGEPHFYLHVFLKGGADSTYLFDSRAQSMRAAEKFHSYRESDAVQWTGVNGGKALVSDIAKALAPHKDQFSILNGVHMAALFDGHPQNVNFFSTGSATGGTLFATDFPKDLQTSLAFILRGNLNNAESSSMNQGIKLEPRVAATLTDLFKKTKTSYVDGLADKYIGSRASSCAGQDSFGVGCTSYLDGLNQEGTVAKKLKEMEFADHGDNLWKNSLDMVHQYFQNSVAKSAILSMNYDLDTHDAVAAKDQPNRFKVIVDDLDYLFKYLKDTPFDSTRSMNDVTTVVINSEFTRTARQVDMPIGETGTDHNQFGNSVIIGGKGIQTGMIVGATDLDTLTPEGEFEHVSQAHMSIDKKLVKPMGKVFDHENLQIINNADPVKYKSENYLNYLSIINTLYELFNVPQEKFKKFNRADTGFAPVLKKLLK
jgi:hypothetical protein